MEDDKENLVSCSPDSGVCCELEPRPKTVLPAGHRLDPSLLGNRRLTLLKSLSADSEYSLDTSLFDAEEFLQDMGFAGSSDPTIPDRFLPSLLQRLSKFPEAEMESLHDRIIQSIGCFRRKEGKRRLFRNLSMGKDSRVEHYGKNLLIFPANSTNYPLLRSNTGPASFPFEETPPETLKAPRLVSADSGHGSLDPAFDEKSIPESPIAILVSSASMEAEGSQFDSRQTSLDETSDTEDNDFCNDGDANQFADTIEELKKLTEQLSDGDEDTQSEIEQDQLGCVTDSDVGLTIQPDRSDGMKSPQDVQIETLSVVEDSVTDPVVDSYSSDDKTLSDGKCATVLKHPLRRTSNSHRYDFKNTDPFELQYSDLNSECSLTTVTSEITDSESGNQEFPDSQVLDQSTDDCSDEKSKDGTEELNSDVDSEPFYDVFQFDRTKIEPSFTKPKYTRDDSLTNFLSSMLDTTDKCAEGSVPISDLRHCKSETQLNINSSIHGSVSPSASLKEDVQEVAKVPNRKRRVLKRMSSSMQCCEDENCRHHDGLTSDAEQKEVEKDLVGPSTVSAIEGWPKVALRITNSAPLSSDSRYMPPPFDTSYQKNSHNAFKVNFTSSQYRSKNGFGDTQNAHRRKERRPCKRRRYLSCPSPQNFNFVPNSNRREMSASMRDLNSEYPTCDPRQQWCACCEPASLSDSSVNRSMRYHHHQGKNAINFAHVSPRDRSPVRSCFRNSVGFSAIDPPFPSAFPSRSSFPSRLSSTIPTYYLCNSSPDVRCVSPELVRTQSGHKQFPPLSRHQCTHQFGGFSPPVDDVFVSNTCCCYFHYDASLRTPMGGNVPEHQHCLNCTSCVDTETPFQKYRLVDSNIPYSKRPDLPYKHLVSRKFSTSRLSSHQNNVSFSDSEVPFLNNNNISTTKNEYYSTLRRSTDQSAFMGHFSAENVSVDRSPKCRNFFHGASFPHDASPNKTGCCRSVPRKNTEQFPRVKFPHRQNSMSYDDSDAPFPNKISVIHSYNYPDPSKFNVDMRCQNPPGMSERFSSDNLPQNNTSNAYTETVYPNVIPVTKCNAISSPTISDMASRRKKSLMISGHSPSGNLLECQKNISPRDSETAVTVMQVTQSDSSCIDPKGTDLSCRCLTSTKISGQLSTDRLPKRQNSISYADSEAPFGDLVSKNIRTSIAIDTTRKQSGSRIHEQCPVDRYPHHQDTISSPGARFLDNTSTAEGHCPVTRTGHNVISIHPNPKEVTSSDPITSLPQSVTDDYCPPPSPDNKREALLEKKIRIFSKFFTNLGNLSKSVPDTEQRGNTANRKLSYTASLPDKRSSAPPPHSGGARRCTTLPPRMFNCHPKDSMNPPSVVQDGCAPMYENRVLLEASGQEQKHSFTPVMFTSSVSMFISGENGDDSKANSKENEEYSPGHCKKSNDISESTTTQMPFNVVSKELEDLQLSIQKAKEMRLCASKELHLLQALLAGEENNKEKRYETTLNIDTSPMKELSPLKNSETLNDLRERAKKRDEGEEASFWQEEIKKVRKETEKTWKAKLDRMESRLESQEEELRRLQSDNENLQKNLESQTLGSPVCQCKSDGLQNGFGRIDSAFEDDEEYLAHKPSIPIQPTRQECERLQERLMEEEQRADQLSIMLDQKLIEMNKLQITLSKQTKEMIELEKSYLQLQCRLKRGNRPALPRLCSRDSPFASKNLCPGPSPPASPHP